METFNSAHLEDPAWLQTGDHIATALDRFHCTCTLSHWGGHHIPSHISVVIELSRAFDSVNHSILCAKLDGFGVRGAELQWSNGYLSGRQQRVSMGTVTSEWSVIKWGVPQGSIL